MLGGVAFEESVIVFQDGRDLNEYVQEFILGVFGVDRPWDGFPLGRTERRSFAIDNVGVYLSRLISMFRQLASGTTD
jgi:hypothetical protein